MEGQVSDILAVYGGLAFLPKSARLKGRLKTLRALRLSTRAPRNIIASVVLVLVDMCNHSSQAERAERNPFGRCTQSSTPGGGS